MSVHLLKSPSVIWCDESGCIHGAIDQAARLPRRSGSAVDADCIWCLRNAVSALKYELECARIDRGGEAA